MASTKLDLRKILLIVVAVAVVAVTAAVLTADHVSPITMIVLAGVVLLSSIVLFLYATSMAKKLKDSEKDSE